MVHSAFHIEPVLKKSNYKITAIDVWGENVVVATEEGALLILQEQTGSHIVEFEVIETRKGFAKKPIVQIQVVEQLGIILTLTTEAIQVNEIPSLDMTAQLLRTRGALNFCLNTELSPPILSCAIKKKLSLLRWDGGGFTEWRDVSLPDVARCHCWCGDVVCVGAARKYVLVNPFNGTEKELFDSNSASPTALCLPGRRELLLGRDNISVFQDAQGRPSRKYGICWSEAPSSLVYVFPYLLAVLPKVVEVQLMESQATVQSLSLRASLMAPCPAQHAALLVANNCIYRLRPVPMPRQVDALMEGQQYETCLSLAELAASDPAVHVKLPAILRAYGLTLFRNSEFDKAMGLFARNKQLDPRHVLALYPDLLPPSYAPPDDVPPPPPDLKGHKLLRAQAFLIKYLRAWRAGRAGGGVEEAGPERTEEMEAEVDTAMLRALVRAEPENVLKFVQGRNKCRVEESEALLEEYDMQHELVALYASHGQHRRHPPSLTLLPREKEGHPLHGVLPTIEYLQALGAAHEPLVLEYSRWVLRRSPEQGLTVFTHPAPSALPLPIDVVLAHLRAFDEDSRMDAGAEREVCLRVLLLEHAIAHGENRATFHNQLVLLLLDAVQRLRQHQSTAAKAAGATGAGAGAGAGGGQLSSQRVAAGSEPGDLGVMRRKLLSLLQTSAYYTPDKMLAKLPMVDLYEERALILSKMGDHLQALSIYAHRLGDMDKAEEYCARHYDPLDERTKEVYLDLLKVYLKPPDASAPMTMQALSLMGKHFHRLDTAKALDVLPPNTPLRSLQPVFESAVRENSEALKGLQISKSLLKADNMQVAADYHTRRARRVVVTSGKKCKLSNKKIGTSAFAVYPNNVVVLLGEKTDPHVCPLTGRDFNLNPVD